MQDVIIIRYGEIGLKGNNIGFFIKKLTDNIKYAVYKFGCTVTSTRGRIEVSNFNNADLNGIIASVKKVFGIASVSYAKLISTNINDIYNTCLNVYEKGKTFKIETNRADKTFLTSSLQVSSDVGAHIINADRNAVVNVRQPEQTIYIDIRESGKTYVYNSKFSGLGGLPVGCQGRGLLLLSGGIDSPVAGFLAAKRGLELHALHFNSYPYTSEQAQEKVLTLKNLMQNYCGKITFTSVNLAPMQELFSANCNAQYGVTLLRRAMMRAANAIAEKQNCGCIITGENLGQVASQTMYGLQTSNTVASLPVLRPLICYDKNEIIQVAKTIGTYETSIQPYEDCCTVFLPKHPATKPSIEKCEAEEKRVPEYDSTLKTAIDTALNMW